MRWIRQRNRVQRAVILHLRFVSSDAAGFEELKRLYTGKLQKCTESRSVTEANRLHGEIAAEGLIRDHFVANLVIHMYGRCGEVRTARWVFESMAMRNRFSWTIIIGAYAQTGHGAEALELFKRMVREGVKPSNVTFVAVLTACSDLGAAGLHEGRAIHANIRANGLDSDPILCNNLVNMYGKCGSLPEARAVFDRFSARDVVCWTAMIAAYALSGHCHEAVDLFWIMAARGGDVRPNNVTFITVLGACSTLQDLQSGRLIHYHIRSTAGADEEDVLVSTALLNMYGKCGSPDEALAVFNRMRRRDVIAWNAIIAAYAQQGQGREALELLRRMDLEGARANPVTFVSVLDGCACFGGLIEGKSIHRRILASGLSSTALGNTLINMYGRCGSLIEARRVFEVMGVQRDAVSWAALITVFAHHGHSRTAGEIFQWMELEGMQPTDVTFISILAACSHAGLLARSREFFRAMVGDHSICPVMEHFACLIDLLGRLGKLRDVKDLIASMPFEPGCAEWRAVLGACRTQSDVERGLDAAEVVSDLDPEHPAAYVLLSGLMEVG